MYIETLAGRFPNYLSEDISIIESTIDLSSKHQSYEPFKVNLESNTLFIPTRIYTDKGQLDKLEKLSLKQKEMVYCLFSRHHDGFVRERCLREFITSNNSFTAPYILKLLGEYVIEIIEVIYQNRENLNKENLLSYISENPEQYERIRQQVYSYWDCFYRSAYPKYKRGLNPGGQCQQDYPGIKMIKYINTLMQSRKRL